jgi:signal transduction histidine kinase/ActR/RegA family two-component response regulator
VTAFGGLDRLVRRTRLSVKLAWLGAGLMAAVVGATVIVLTLQIRANTRRRFEDELRRNQSTFAQFEQQKLAQLSFGASLISRTASLPYALETYRAEASSNGVRRGDLARTVQNELEQLVTESGRDMLFVTDESGRVFASAARRGKPFPVGTDLSRMPEIKQGLDERERIARGGLAVLRQSDGDYQIAVYPVELGGYTLGALVLGERLDSASLKSASAAFDGYAVVSVGETIASGSFPGMNDRAVHALLAAQTAATGPATISIADQEFVVAPLPLGTTQDGAQVRLWLLQPLTQTVRALTRPLLKDFLVYGLMAVLCAAIGAALLARSVLGPFDRFVRYLREGTAAERLESRFDASDAPAEVRTLNESFGALMDALHLSEAQLRQAQKLEAVGTLAGGIAHDFNNLLTVITGFSQMALADAGADSSLTEDLGQVISASERATVLTRQLLAFSRKQVLQPTVLDLCAAVEDVAPMLRRLVGEHILIRIETERADLPRVLADRGQIEQVIINLVVNARDAMPLGGRIVIHVGRSPEGVMMAVADNGSGMPADVRERIFEPFFTTKEPGKGTGLGLSTVYGIVKQSGGTIEVESAIGSGTTFTVVLPASDAPLSSAAAGADLAVPGGTETILLVEDEPSVRALAQRALEGRGYKVLAAGGHADALALVARTRVDLLLTDVVMPEMAGPKLAERVLALQPAVGVLYMSGYADETLRPFDIGAEVIFLRKPFTAPELARIVRLSLDSSAVKTSAVAI